MDYLPHVFKGVGLIFTVAALFTGAQALSDPEAFATSFGLSLKSKSHQYQQGKQRPDDAISSTRLPPATSSYVSLMGVRQFATGVILAAFIYQSKWDEVATILVIIGFLVAGTDGYHLWRAGEAGLAMYHAVPGALIAAISGAFLVEQ